MTPEIKSQLKSPEHKPEVVFLPAKKERGFGWMELFLGVIIGGFSTLAMLALICAAMNLKH